MGDGIVFVGDLAGVVHAVDTATGDGLWTYETGNEIKSSPAVAGDRILIGSYDEHLYALSVRDGDYSRGSVGIRVVNTQALFHSLSVAPLTRE